jgi:hypothetical protein
MRPADTVHSPRHWIAVATVLAATLFMLSEAHGQHTGAAAVFDGRPAMSGAQGGQGALAGPPQGGVGVQGSDDAALSITRRPRTVTTPRGEMRAANATRSAGAAGTGPAAAAGSGDSVLSPDRGDVNVAPRGDRGVAPRKDTGVAKDQRSAVKKTRRAAKKVVRKDWGPATRQVAP